MVIEIICGGLGVASMWVIQKWMKRKIIYQYEVRLYTDYLNENLVFAFPITRDTNDVDNIEHDMYELCNNPIFKSYMEDCNIGMILLYDCKLGYVLSGLNIKARSNNS